MSVSVLVPVLVIAPLPVPTVSVSVLVPVRSHSGSSWLKFEVVEVSGRLFARSFADASHGFAGSHRTSPPNSRERSRSHCDRVSGNSRIGQMRQTNSGTFLKLHRSSDKGSRSPSRSSTSATSTRTPRSAHPSFISPLTPSLPHHTLLSRRASVPEPPCCDNGIRTIPVKNTFLHFPNKDGNATARAASEPMLHDVVSLSNGTPDDFYVGEALNESSTQTTDQMAYDDGTTRAHAGSQTTNFARMPDLIVLLADDQLRAAPAFDTVVACNDDSVVTLVL